MNSEKILKELSAFPKEFRQSEEQKSNNFRQIMSHYKDHEKTRRSFATQKLMVGSAGVFAVLLAFFLILSNTDILTKNQGDENPTHEKQEKYISKSKAIKVAEGIYPDAKWEEPKFTKQKKGETKDRPTWLVTGALPSGKDAIVYVDAITGVAYKNEEIGSTHTEGFYPDKLDEVTRVEITDGTGIRKAVYADSVKIGAITNLLKSAELYAENDPDRESSITGETYYLTFKIGNEGDQITAQFWPNETGQNLLDNDSRSWWTVKGMNELVVPYLPKWNVHDSEEAVQIAKSYRSDVTWDLSNESTVQLVNEDSFNIEGNMVWKVVGITSVEEQITIYINPINGKVLKEDSQTTATGAEAVSAFFEKVQNGNLDGAWDMIHSRAKVLGEEASKDSFTNYFTKNKLELDQIVSENWDNRRTKFPECMCSFSESIAVKAKFVGGITKEFHVVRLDESEEWKLFWSNEEKDLK